MLAASRHAAAGRAAVTCASSRPRLLRCHLAGSAQCFGLSVPGWLCQCCSCLGLPVASYVLVRAWGFPTDLVDHVCSSRRNFRKLVSHVNDSQHDPRGGSCARRVQSVPRFHSGKTTLVLGSSQGARQGASTVTECTHGVIRGSALPSQRRDAPGREDPVQPVSRLPPSIAPAVTLFL